MKVKTSELKGAALDWAVAQCEGISVQLQSFSPSTNWSMGMPIIEREGIEVRKGNDLFFPQGNENGDYYEPLWLAGKQHGQTPLIAGLRFYVASKLGKEIEVPEELT